MDAETFDKSELPSRHVPVGPTCAPHRSYDGAMPCIADLKPGELQGGGLSHEVCLTVTGKTITQKREIVKFNTNQRVVYPLSNPILASGGVVGLRDASTPKGAIVKVASMIKFQVKGPTRCFDRDQNAFAAVECGKIEDGEVLVIRYEGSHGGTAAREMPSMTAALHGRSLGDKIARNTDRRLAGPTRGFRMGHLGPAAAVDGPVALVKDSLVKVGNCISIDADTGTLDREVVAPELEKRRKAWTAPTNPNQSGVFRKYAGQVGPAVKGAVTHPGGKADVVCYADI